MPPRHVTIPDACKYGPDSRVGIYRKAARFRGLLVKDGSRSYVDLDVYDVIRAARPPAVINVGKTKPSVA